MRTKQKLTFVAALAVGSFSGCPAARAVAAQNTQPLQAVHPGANRRCPVQAAANATLGQASTQISLAQYQDAAVTLKPLVEAGCDPRASLLFAAAIEAGGDAPGALDVLERAHAAWPMNTSIAASLARQYLNAGQTDKAVQALKHFEVTSRTPQQEMEEAVLVYFAAHQLASAHAVAAAEYREYPSLHTLLLLANALQLEGRYPEVNQLLQGKREAFADQPEFLITLAESESDAAIYPQARKDLEQAIVLDPKSHQAHYLLGYVLLRMNDADPAIGEFHRAIDLGSRQPRTFYQLALALRSKQDDAGEEQALTSALAIDDRYAPAQCEVGRILLEQHRASDALDHLNAAIQYNPHSEEAYFLLVKAYRELGERDKSEEMVKRLVALKRENRNGRQSPKGPDAPINDAPLKR
ncbi:MAG TPA: tetratricopeptide repeat protein [Terracidiphilus sp.]|jgi:predicted Zn-dependent protease|nr:tetratricopeptide repeat protein [Terracidiphilus sp.]